MDLLAIPVEVIKIVAYNNVYCNFRKIARNPFRMSFSLEESLFRLLPRTYVMDKDPRRRTVGDIVNRMGNRDFVRCSRNRPHAPGWWTRAQEIYRSFSLRKSGTLLLCELSKWERANNPYANYAIVDGTRRALAYGLAIKHRKVIWSSLKVYIAHNSLKWKDGRLMVDE
jgi:hypothetical protein